MQTHLVEGGAELELISALKQKAVCVHQPVGYWVRARERTRIVLKEEKFVAAGL